MSINIDQVMQTFIVEADELLQSMEESLLALENNPNDKDTIGAVFRAAHTIKGSAGLFGLTSIVSFTHILEDLLDQVRNGDLTIERELVALLLQCGDHLHELLEVEAVQRRELTDDSLERDKQLRLRLHTYQQKNTNAPASVNTETHAHEADIIVREDETVISDLWHLSLRFGINVFRNGMDPLSFLRYLQSLGDIVTITTLADAIPSFSQMDPESCYLGFELDFNSAADKSTIASVFDFVAEDCEVRILPPHSKVAEYIDLIKQLPEGSTRLGEILVESGALTAHELEQGLGAQRASTESNTPAGFLGEILVEQRSVEPELIRAALEKQTQVKEKKNKDSSFIRVQADKLDSLINLVGELVIAGAGANLFAHNSKNSSLIESTSRVSELVENIRDGALRMRMVPIGDTFNRFQRVVRDVSEELGKDIMLHVSGGDTEVDKTVIEKIGDPLMHLLRNSMDHGIESPEQRLAAGKSAKGNLYLNAFHDSGSMVIEVSDDGSGLNRERILQKAIERELVAPGVNLSDKEIYQLIFEAGFSTADVVTNLSGRGKLLDEIVPSINKTSDLVQEISAASEEQASGVGQINTAMTQLNQITQKNASSSEELAATSEEMSSQAEQLQQAMSFFTLESNSNHKKTNQLPSAKDKKTAHPSRTHTHKTTVPLAANSNFAEHEFTRF